MDASTTLRDAFFDRLYDRAREDHDIVLVVADMAAPSLDKFRRDLPDQFVNVGIAEQNAILIASGLALGGKKVFVYAISPFITLRCLEQIRVNNAIMGIPINIVGMGTGYSYCNDGPTHHLIEDISIMRSLPRVHIYNPIGPGQAAQMVDLFLDSRETNYIRLDKDIYPEVAYPIPGGNDPGMAQVREGGGFCILSTGPILHKILPLLEKYSSLDIALVDLYKFPINEQALIPLIQGKKRLITVEEHFLPGGMGSAVAEILADNQLFIPLKRMGIPLGQEYKASYQYGGRERIQRFNGIDGPSIEKNINSFFAEAL